MTAFLLALSLLTAEPDTTAFRVETELFVGAASEPETRWFTLFDASTAWDVEADNGSQRILVYDFQKGFVTKLDIQREKQSSVSFAELERMLAELRLGLTEEQSRAFGPDVRPQSLPGSRWRAVLPGWTYEVQGQPEPNEGAAGRFALFANNAARLNVLDHRGRPPFVRIQLNEALAKGGQVPSTVSVMSSQGTAGRRESQRTVHRFAAGLTAADLRLIGDARKMIESFGEVEWQSIP